MEKNLEASRLPLSIYLLKSEIDNPETVLATSDFSNSITLSVGENLVADLYIGRTEGAPGWLTTLSQFSVAPPELPRSSSISGLLIIPVRDRNFVLTFGHAWQRMKPKIIEPNFGIRCVLNLAERNSLRAIRRDRVAEDFIQAIEQIPDSDEIERFGIDVERDLLRGVKAKLKPEKEFGRWVAGSDSFKASIDLTKESLLQFLNRCLSLWALKDYQKEFSWVDNIAPVRDEVLEQELTESLVMALKGSQANFVLCVPDLLQWDDFDIFSFQAKKKKHSPCADILDLSMWLSWLNGTGAALDSDALASHQIYAYRDDGTPVQSWSVLSCIHGMLEHKGEQYLVHGSHWFRVEKFFVDRINKRIAAIPSASVALPAPGLKEKEGCYDLRAAKDSCGSLLYMDKKLVGHGGGKSRFEICDLFTDNGHLICVKPWGERFWVPKSSLRASKGFDSAYQQ